MDFFDQITSNITPEFNVLSATSFSYFISIEELNIHFVKIEGYNPKIYKKNIETLRKNHGHFITVFEDVFKSCPEKIIKRIQYHLGNSNRIHGRETFLKKITKPEAIEFLRKNHINIPLKTKYSFGLINKNKKLVAIACFGQVIRMRNGSKSSELIRFCNLSGSRVVGGLTKLINEFQKLHQLDELMTYCDLEWSDGLNFEKLGFRKIETSLPTEFVINLNTWARMHTSIFNGLNMHNKGKYRIISNLGSIKFIKYFNEK
ncbi:MAG: hypothetical protein CMD18_08490 [Flavobacteriales bacterium]|nr:hypothetical protein [Flavobacteriales bacterium]